MVKVNYDLLPVKTHYFFFMAAMGPILPFLPVIGKQLGVSEVVMGLIMSVIPILFLFAKPIFGFILDYFQSHRKTVFLTLVVSTTVFSALLWLVPEYKLVPVQQQVACGSILNCTDQLFLQCCLYLVNCSVVSSFHGPLSFGNKKKSQEVRSGEYSGCGIISVFVLAKTSRTSNDYLIIDLLSFELKGLFNKYRDWFPVSLMEQWRGV
ncbi:hypothetical protein J6590_075650 [Homalodisca vitripennis]|nr:hypothetical protein J6590_075650 [Homalodisca vitripennis]